MSRTHLTLILIFTCVALRAQAQIAIEQACNGNANCLVSESFDNPSGQVINVFTPSLDKTDPDISFEKEGYQFDGNTAFGGTGSLSYVVPTNLPPGATVSRVLRKTGTGTGAAHGKVKGNSSFNLPYQRIGVRYYGYNSPDFESHGDPGCVNGQQDGDTKGIEFQMTAVGNDQLNIQWNTPSFNGGNQPWAVRLNFFTTTGVFHENMSLGAGADPDVKDCNGHWCRFETYLGTDAANGFTNGQGPWTFEVQMEPLTGSGGGFNATRNASFTIDPGFLPVTFPNMLAVPNLNREAASGCDGHREISLMTVWGWTTNAGQQIPVACEMEGGCGGGGGTWSFNSTQDADPSSCDEGSCGTVTLSATATGSLSTGDITCKVDADANGSFETTITDGVNGTCNQSTGAVSYDVDVSSFNAGSYTFNLQSTNNDGPLTAETGIPFAVDGTPTELSITVDACPATCCATTDANCVSHPDCGVATLEGDLTSSDFAGQDVTWFVACDDLQATEISEQCTFPGNCPGDNCTCEDNTSCNYAGISGPYTANATMRAVRNGQSTPNVTSPVEIKTTAPPTAPGIALMYPGDVEIKMHPAVIWHDDFERSLAEITTQVNDPEGNSVYYTNIDPAQIGVVADAHADSAGTQSLEIDNDDGSPNSGYLFRQLNSAQRSVVSNNLYRRFYIKYEGGKTFHHEGVWAGAYHDNAGAGAPFPWGRAGCCQDVDDNFLEDSSGAACSGDDPISCPFRAKDWFGGFESLDDSSVDGTISLGFYEYYPTMQLNLQGVQWANQMPNNDRVDIPDDTWTCIEVHESVGSVGQSNGVLAAWVNDEEVVRFTQGQPTGFWSGVSWNNDAEAGEPFPGIDLLGGNNNLRPNFIYILNGESGANGYIRVDDLVVASARIGCVSTGAPVEDVAAPTLSGNTHSGGGT